MKSFDSKAEEAIPCVRIADADGTAYRITEDGLLPADEIGTDEFPQYGDWLPCKAVTADGDELGDRYLETPGVLASELVRVKAETGTEFRLAECSQAGDEQWHIEVETL